MTGHPEDHHTLQVVVVFEQLEHVQTLDVKSEQGQKQKPKAPCNHPRNHLCEMKHNLQAVPLEMAMLLHCVAY